MRKDPQRPILKGTLSKRKSYFEMDSPDLSHYLFLVQLELRFSLSVLPLSRSQDLHFEREQSGGGNGRTSVLSFLVS